VYQQQWQDESQEHLLVSPPAHTRGNTAAQAHPSPLHLPGQVTSAVRLTTELPYTPDSQLQPQGSHRHSELIGGGSPHTPIKGPAVRCDSISSKSRPPLESSWSCLILQTPSCSLRTRIILQQHPFTRPTNTKQHPRTLKIFPILSNQTPKRRPFAFSLTSPRSESAHIACADADRTPEEAFPFANISGTTTDAHDANR
jgi:hypothetical protein